MVATNLQIFPWLKLEGFFWSKWNHNENKMKSHPLMILNRDCWIFVERLFRGLNDFSWFLHVMQHGEYQPPGRKLRESVWNTGKFGTFGKMSRNAGLQQTVIGDQRTLQDYRFLRWVSRKKQLMGCESPYFGGGRSAVLWQNHRFIW